MRTAMPVKIGTDTFRVAGSSVHLGYIRENLARITEFIHRVVENDSVMFELQEVSEDSPLAWNDRELLRHIVDDDAGVGNFIAGLKLSLN